MARTKKQVEVVETVKFAEPTEHDFSVILTPVVTEKSMNLMRENNKIVLKVAKTANAEEIKSAFERIFGKKVEKVNTVNVRAKAKRMGRYEGKTSAYKKAYIKLAKGETLDLFEEEK